MRLVNDLFSVSGIIFIVVTILWLLEFKIFTNKTKSEVEIENESEKEIEGDNEREGVESNTEKNKGKETFHKILIGIVITIIITVVFTIIDFGTVSRHYSLYYQWTGLFIYITGLILRYWCSYLLGQHFTRGVTVTETQELVSSGPYRFVRHPLYLGLMLLTLGVPVFFGNFITLIIGSGLMIPAIKSRIVEEENQLLEIMGNKYHQWRIKRYRLLPFVY